MSVKLDPTFTLYVGPMFSSKSSRLFLTLETLKHKNKNVVLFKPAADTRYEQARVTTHNGMASTTPVVVVSDINEIFAHLASLDTQPDVIAVDEAFMLKGIADTLIMMFRMGITIFVASIDIGYDGKRFLEVEKMMPWATHIEKCTAVCAVCNEDARYTHKKVEDDVDAEIQVGGIETYEPRCFECHPLIRTT